MTATTKRFACSITAASLLALSACSKAPEPKAELPRAVKAMRVGMPDRFEQASFTGKAKATREVTVAFEASGRIVRLPVAVGDQVTEGQELMALDPRDFANNLARAKAELTRATAQKERMEQALKTNAVSEQEFTDAKAGVAAAQALHDIAQKQLEDTVLRAPYDSTVVARYVEEFENVLIKQKVLRLLDVSKIEMVVDVPENMIPDVPHVTNIDVTFTPFPDLVLSGTISEVGSEASLSTRTYPVTLVIEQPENAQILAGMAGKATITAELPPERLKDGITVLPAAIFSTNDSQQSYVWIVDESSGQVSQRPVTVDRFTKYGVLITEGLQPGEWVVTAGVHSLVEGQTVKLMGSNTL